MDHYPLEWYMIMVMTCVLFFQGYNYTTVNVHLTLKGLTNINRELESHDEITVQGSLYIT